MPVFQAHVPVGKFAPEQKRALGRAPHGPDELFLDPSYMGMSRSDDAVIITVLFAAERDVFIALIAAPRQSFAFGGGELQLAPDHDRASV